MNVNYYTVVCYVHEMPQLSFKSADIKKAQEVLNLWLESSMSATIKMYSPEYSNSIGAYLPTKFEVGETVFTSQGIGVVKSVLVMQGSTQDHTSYVLDMTRACPEFDLEKDKGFSESQVYRLTPERLAVVNYAESKNWEWQENDGDRFLLYEKDSGHNKFVEKTVIAYKRNSKILVSQFDTESQKSEACELPAELFKILVSYIESKE